MIDSNGNIVRVEDDTYPEKFIYTINGSKVDVSDWDVYLHYKEAQGTIPETYKNIRITGVKDIFRPSEIAFYPRALYCKEYANNGSLIGPYTGFAKVGVYDFMTTRENVFYYADSNGTYVINNEFNYDEESYVPYDSEDPSHEDLQRFSTYTEKMTHDSGTITITSKISV